MKAETHMTHNPAEALRAETGPMQFPDDWTGVFIRGDNAAFYAGALRAVLKLLPANDAFNYINIISPLEGLASDLESSNHNKDDRPPPQQAQLAAHTSPAPAGGEVALRQAVNDLLPWLEDAETKCIVGHEGCVWAVEQLRHALEAVTPPPSPDVAGVVERLQARIDAFDMFKRIGRNGTLDYNAEDASLDTQARAILESLSAEKGRLMEALTEIARQKLADSMPSQDWADTDFEEAYDCCIRRARTALTPKEKA